MSKVRYTLLDSKPLRRGTWYPSVAIFSREGKIVVASADVNKQATLYSPDAGRSWREIEPVLDRFHFAQLRDGSLIGLSSHSEVAGKVARSQRFKPFVMGVRRAASIDALVAGEFEDDFAYTRIPELAGACGDSSNYFTGFCDHGIVELPNGDLIATMYGHFYGDDVPIGFFSTPTYQYRAWVVVSRDGGRSFEYLSTIADTKTYPVGDHAEGYCEEDLIAFADGRLLCVMRSGGAVVHGRDGYTPAFSSTSCDGGMSWSKPTFMYDFGVFPREVLLQNGLVVATAGRDGVYLIASADGGASWLEPEFVSTNDGPWGRSPSGYSSLGLVGENEVLLIYDDIDADNPPPAPGAPEDKDYSCGSRHVVTANRYRVELI